MDWKSILSQPPETYDEGRLEEIFNELIQLDQKVKMDSKQYKKLFRLCLCVLRLKSRQINGLQSEINENASHRVSLRPEDADSDEILKLKNMIERLEADRAHYKSKCREHTQEISLMQKRLQDYPDEDSGDALSDLDRQQELMNNISVKNKHIKRLLRDIEDLEAQNLRQAQQITDFQVSQTDEKIHLATLSQQFNESQTVIAQYKEANRKQLIEIEKLQKQYETAVKEREQLSNEIEVFSHQLEERALVWKDIFDSKDKELKEMQAQYEEVMTKHPGYDIDIERGEVERLKDTLNERGIEISNLEITVKALSEEIEALKEENQALFEEKVQLEREKSNRDDRCCTESKVLLEKSNERCHELQEMLTTVEEDNTIKAKQAFETMETLKAYEKGQFGLPDALSKINKLEDKLVRKDKKIKDLVADVNAANELAMENCILRKKLGIPVNQEISTKNFVAQQHRFEKMNEKLTLKLQGYEEIVLRLKLECNELRRSKDRGDKGENIIDQDARLCDECYKPFDAWKGCKSCIEKQNCKYCEGCQAKLKLSFDDDFKKDFKKLKGDYQGVMEENENLRIGMQEILQQIRECNAQSSDIKIVSSTLEKLLHALDSRSISGWYHPAMRLQHELKVTKERELALMERLKNNEGIIQALEQRPINVISEARIDNNQTTERMSTLERELQERSSELEKVRKMVEVDDESQMQILKENDRLKSIERLYNQVIVTLDKSDKEKDRLLVNAMKEIEEIELKMEAMNRKLNYFKQENTNLLNTVKQIQLDYLNDMQKWKTDSSKIVVESPPFSDEMKELEEENQKLKLQFSSKVAELFKGKVELGAKVPEKVSVIKENLCLEYITMEELNELKRQAKTKKNEANEIKAKVKNLENVLEIVNEQLKEQQKIITRQSDEEINLRHLVADLQSETTDHYQLVRTQRELDEARIVEKDLREEIESLKTQMKASEKSIDDLKAVQDMSKNQKEEERRIDLLKIRFLKKSLVKLRDSYQMYTPLISIVDYLQMYKSLQSNLKPQSPKLPDPSFIEARCKSMSNQSDIKLKIDLLQLEAKNLFLNNELRTCVEKLSEMTTICDQLKLKSIEEGQHWNTITMLFDEKSTKSVHSKETQTKSSVASKAVSTDDNEKIDLPEKPPNDKVSPKKMTTEACQKSFEIQLKQALGLASTRSALLLDTETRLAETRSRIMMLEKALDEKDSQLKMAKNVKTVDDRKEDNILSITIASLQNLLLEKDTTVSRYQELLKVEREEFNKSYEEQIREIKRLKREINKLEEDIERKERIIIEKETTAVIQEKKSESEESTSEEKYEQKRLESLELEITKLKIEIQEREKILSNQISEKDLEIMKLKEVTGHESVVDNISNLREIDQLREYLEEKDRHIQDLTETLTQFHDDQTKFINDTDIHSTEQVTQLSVDLNRCESSKKVLKTQLEAVKRQLANVTTRENQAREMIRSLKAQLIKRPVISVKSETMASTREDQLRKRNQQLELDLTNIRDELRRQQTLIDGRRAKSASDLGLWEKQKRWQQIAEKLKEQLRDRDLDIARLDSTLTLAKNSIARLEREKHILEQRTRSYCTSASCPNLHTKFISESPESYATSSPEGPLAMNILNESNRELVEALKSRVEAQQRRIMALELEGKGENAMLREIDKLEETCSELQEQNVKLEAKFLQAQLENDKLRHSEPENRLMQNQIKHLEEYVSNSKGELFKHKSALDQAVNKIKEENSKNEQLEKTIATLRAMIDRLKLENKTLKEYKPGTTRQPHMSPKKSPSPVDSGVSRELYESLKTEYDRMQKMYSEVTDKLTSLQVELQLQTNVCSQCRGRRDSSSSEDTSDENLREKLDEKTKLLEKAKTLLTRAAAKEKNLRDQIAYLRRRCSELQNVPVIEEASE